MARSARVPAAILLALAFAAGAAPAQEARDGGPAAVADGGAAEGPDGGPTPHRAFSGRVAGVDWAAQRLTVESAGRPVAMTFDRNTQVYLPERLGTLRDLAPGVEVRAAQGPTGLAIWVEVLRGAAAPDGGAASSPPSGSRP
jgi:hypothetical protein